MTDIDWSQEKLKWERLNALITKDHPNEEVNNWYLREIFYSYDESDYQPEPDTIYDKIGDALEILDLVRHFFSLSEQFSWGPYRDELSRLALEMSLCPMHLCDYMACFDDDNEECSQIRTLFPSHDT